MPAGIIYKYALDRVPHRVSNIKAAKWKDMPDMLEWTYLWRKSIMSRPRDGLKQRETWKHKNDFYSFSDEEVFYILDKEEALKDLIWYYDGGQLHFKKGHIHYMDKFMLYCYDD